MKWYDVVRILIISGAAFSIGAHWTILRNVVSRRYRGISFAYIVLMAMAALEQASRVGHGGLSWRFYALAVALIFTVPCQRRMIRDGMSVPVIKEHA